MFFLGHGVWPKGISNMHTPDQCSVIVSKLVIYTYKYTQYNTRECFKVTIGIHRSWCWRCIGLSKGDLLCPSFKVYRPSLGCWVIAWIGSDRKMILSGRVYVRSSNCLYRNLWKPNVCDLLYMYQFVFISSGDVTSKGSVILGKCGGNKDDVKGRLLWGHIVLNFLNLTKN